ISKRRAIFNWCNDTYTNGSQNATWRRKRSHSACTDFSHLRTGRELKIKPKRRRDTLSQHIIATGSYGELTLMPWLDLTASPIATPHLAVRKLYIYTSNLKAKQQDLDEEVQFLRSLQGRHFPKVFGNIGPDSFVSAFIPGETMQALVLQRIEAGSFM